LLSQLISHSTFCKHLKPQFFPLFKVIPTTPLIATVSQLLWGFTLLAHLLGFCLLFVLVLVLLLVLLLVLALCLPFFFFFVSCFIRVRCAVWFLFRLVASPLAYQKVTYLTRHKWKSKRLISSSFSSSVCLFASSLLSKSWRKSTPTYQLTEQPTLFGPRWRLTPGQRTWKSAGKAPFGAVINFKS